MGNHIHQTQFSFSTQPTDIFQMSRTSQLPPKVRTTEALVILMWTKWFCSVQKHTSGHRCHGLRTRL